MDRKPALLLLGLSLVAINPAVAQGIPTNTVGEVLTENVQWRSFPAFPEAVRLAILVGDPQKPGPFVVRVKVPADAKIMPHMPRLSGASEMSIAGCLMAGNLVSATSSASRTPTCSWC